MLVQMPVPLEWHPSAARRRLHDVAVALHASPEVSDRWVLIGAATLEGRPMGAPLGYLDVLEEAQISGSDWGI